MVKGFCSIRSTNERSALKKNAPKHVVQSKQDSEADVEYLKTLVVSTENIPVIKTKLVATQKFRLEMMKIMEVDLLETFPYFFTDPALVFIKKTLLRVFLYDHIYIVNFRFCSTSRNDLKISTLTHFWMNGAI